MPGLRPAIVRDAARTFASPERGDLRQLLDYSITLLRRIESASRRSSDPSEDRPHAQPGGKPWRLGQQRTLACPSAVEGSATVALGVANTSSPDCRLEIWPAEKNGFSSPATLTVDCRNVANDQLSNYAMYWADPVAKQWVELSGSQVNLSNKTVSVSILHFSEYSVGPRGGKAGW